MTAAASLRADVAALAARTRDSAGPGTPADTPERVDVACVERCPDLAGATARELVA